MGTGFAKKKKQAKILQQQFSKMQNDMQNVEVTGTAGNGLVTITLNGEHEMKQLKIKPECVDSEDIEGLEDLIKAAYRDALSKLKNETMKGLPDVGGGMPGIFN